MGYLICQECGGYYKLENGESKEDFVSCECYGSLTYVEDIDGYLKENNKSDHHPPITLKDNTTRTENLDSEADSDNLEEDVLEDEPSPVNQKLESFSFPSFKGSDNPRVKDRNYYRKINSKEEKPDIGKLKLIKDVNGIIEALNYNDAVVKLEAVKALGNLGDERALTPLNKVKTEKTGILKTYAQNAIFHIESKNRGLKSRNRAYYRKEYNKAISSENNKNKPLNQSVNKITGAVTFKSPKKTKEVFKNNQVTSMGASDTLQTDIDKQTVTHPNHSEPRSNPGNQKHTPEHKSTSMNKSHGSDKSISEVKSSSKDKPSIKSNLRNVLYGNKKEVEDGNGVEVISEGVKTQKNVSKPNSGNLFSKTNNFPETKTKTTNRSYGPKGHEDFVKYSNSTQATEQSNSSLGASSVVKRDITITTTPNNGGIKEAPSTKVMDGDYFIQFLGIKNTDKPLIGFIFLFAASLIFGVLLTMGYN